MSEIEFTPWPKIARLYRDCVITEKLDGTNAAVGVTQVAGYTDTPHPLGTYVTVDGSGHYLVHAQSRTRLITPEQDNFGFARWVRDNAEGLARALGTGLHFGEYWGSGIQRGYGLVKGEKRFSLFNTPRYTKPEFDLTQVPNLGTVPVLYHGVFNTHTVDHQIEILRRTGSIAAPGFMSPEGVVTFHIASGTAFKTTLEGDEKPKGSNELG